MKMLPMLFVCFLVIVLVSLSLSVFAVAPANGDVNGDGKVTVLDAVLIMKYVVNKQKPVASFEPCVADVDGQNGVTATDAVLVARFVAGGYNVTLKPAAHTLVKTDARESSCTTPGNSAYWSCTVCEKLFSDADGNMEISLQDTVIAATGHTYETDWSYDSTHHWHACENCDERKDSAAHTMTYDICSVCRVNIRDNDGDWKPGWND